MGGGEGERGGGEGGEGGGAGFSSGERRFEIGFKVTIGSISGRTIALPFRLVGSVIGVVFGKVN